MDTLTKAPPSAATPLVGATPVLAPTCFAELVQFAQMAAKSQLVPKDYRGRPEDIMFAVQLGSEVGLRPMQALQNIAVINGRPAVWGDALPGLCKASPAYEDIIETWEHEADPEFLIAVCTAKRHGATPVTARFGVPDAKRAGLWTKPGPWQPYPRRMLQMRARSFALRDAFPDVLKGLIAVEEALDSQASADRLAPPTSDVTAAQAPAPAPAHAPPAVYALTTKQGTTTFRSSDEWLAAWAKLVRGCKAARALNKLQRARETNRTNILAVAAIDPAPAATLNAQLEHALCGHDQTRLSQPRPGGVAARAAPTHGHATARMLDEAEAILADLEGPAALAEMREIAARNRADLTPPGDAAIRATRRHPG